MSRGYSIKLSLTKDHGGIGEYQVFASGWDQPNPDRLVAVITINKRAQHWAFDVLHDWKDKKFLIPSYQDLFSTNEEDFSNKYTELCPGLWWWNLRLLSAIKRIIEAEDFNAEIEFLQ